MSLVTTPSRSSPANAPHNAAIRLLFPVPTGPPTPIRNARSTGKETLPLLEVDRGRKLDRDRRGRRQGAAVGGDRPGGDGHRRREPRKPPGRHGRIERQELQSGG